MSLAKYLMLEKDNFFNLSYSLSPDKFPYLRDRMEKHLPDLKVVERGNTSYGYFQGSEDALFKYDWERQVMSADHTYNDLMNLRPRDLNNEQEDTE